ncbi:MAG: glycosyltransferase family 4 protein [Nitrospirota bacterium]
MNDRRRILIVAPEYPYPPYDGHTNRIYNLFRHFASGCKFDLVAFGRDDLSTQSDGILKGQLGPCFDSVELIPRNTLNKIEIKRGIDSIRNILYPYENSIGEPYYSDALARRVKEKVLSGHYDLIFLCGLYIALYFDKNMGSIPYVVDMADSMSLLMRSYFKAEKKPVEKFKKYLNYIWAERYEKIYCSRIPNIIMCNDVDAQKIRKNCPKSRVWSVQAGVDTNYYRHSNSTTRSRGLLFTGVMEYAPNNLAMLYFIRKIFPLIKKEASDVTLTIAGRNPSHELIALADQTQGIRVTGYVDDLRPFFDSSLIYISPLITGAGIKNKILEAWAMSMPVVATSMSCSGIETENNFNILIGDRPKEFADKVMTLLADESLRTKLSRNGRQTVEHKYSWSTRSRMLKEIFDSLLGQ